MGANKSIVIDTTAPTVSITSPASGTSYTNAQTVAVNATATDNTGVTKVGFYDGTTLKGTNTTSPYSYSWAFTIADNGVHVWTARAYDPDRQRLNVGSGQPDGERRARSSDGREQWAGLHGSTLNLTASTMAGATYSWSGRTASPRRYRIQRSPIDTGGQRSVQRDGDGLRRDVSRRHNDCDGEPGRGGRNDDTAAAGVVCSGSGTTITLTGQAGAIVKWQSSTNNVTWTDIASTAIRYRPAI